MQAKQIQKTDGDDLFEKSQSDPDEMSAEVLNNPNLMKYLKPRIAAANSGDVVRITDKEIIEATIKRNHANI